MAKTVAKPKANNPPVAPKVEGTKPKRYDTVRVELCNGERAVTVGKAKELLGWITETDYIQRLKQVDPNANEDEAKFGADYFLTDLQGQKVRCSNNTKNRPWSEGVSKAYMQDLLKKNWMFNGETIIIGEHGNVLSGQHRLIGLILAEQTRVGADKLHWEEFWTTPVTMESVIVYGISEDPKVTRSIDNVKTRTLSDVIYADTELFGKYKPAERKTVSRMLDYSVRLLWKRTGENKETNWAPKRTHAESLGFVDNHPKLKECISFIFTENGGQKDQIGHYIYPGHAAALLYLMACSDTKDDAADDYFVTKPSNEKRLSFGNFKKAKMFWSDIARYAEEMKALRLARCPVSTDKVDEGEGFSGLVFSDAATFDQKVAVIIKAWNAYVNDEPITDETLNIVYDLEKVHADPKDDNSAVVYRVYHQKEFPTIKGGIDIGDAPKKKKEKEPKEEDKKDEVEQELNELGSDDLDPSQEGEDGGDGEDEEDTDDGETGEEISSEEPDKANEARTKWQGDKSHYGDHTLFYKNLASGNFVCMFDDALSVAQVTGHTPREHPVTKATQVVLGGADLEADMKKLMDAGHHPLVIEIGTDGNRKVYPYGGGEEKPEQENGKEIKRVIKRKPQGS